MMRQNKGFTLIELLIVIAIIGILSTLAIVALGNTRAKARDTKRVADISQISKALELYYADNGSYPALITPGQSITGPDGKTYMAVIPNNPTPRNDAGCGDNNYTYGTASGNSEYSLNFCLASNSGSLGAGFNSASSAGVGTAAGLLAWWKFDEGSGTNAPSVSGIGNASWYGSGSHFAAGKNGLYAGQFNGSDDYLKTANDSGLSMGTQDWTSMAWVKTSSNTVFVLGGVNVGLWQFYINGSGYIVGYLNDGVAATSFSSSSVVNDNSWHHVAAVFTRSGNGQTYVDGLANGTPSAISSIGNVNTNNIFIGRHPAAASNFISGLIDDPRVYNRALSAAEIKAIYDATK